MPNTTARRTNSRRSAYPGITHDIYRLYGQDIGRRALARKLLERVIQHKRLFFSQAWAHYETAKARHIPSSSCRGRSDSLKKTMPPCRI